MGTSLTTEAERDIEGRRRAVRRLCCDNGGTPGLLHEIPARRPCGIAAAYCPEIAKKHANLLHRRAGLAAGPRAGLNPEHPP